MLATDSQTDFELLCSHTTNGDLVNTEYIKPKAVSQPSQVKIKYTNNKTVDKGEKTNKNKNYWKTKNITWWKRDGM